MNTKNKKIFIQQYLFSGIIFFLIYFTGSHDYSMAIPIAIPIIAAALGAAGGAISASGGSGGSVKRPYSAKNTNKRLGEFALSDPTYTSSPYAANTLGLAQTILNGRMAGASSRERNIYGAGANAMGNINRNVTDSSQALALGAGIQGQEGQQFDQLQQMEGQDYYNKLQNLNQANAGMTAEGDKIHDDQVRRWQDQVNIALTQYKIRTKKRADTAKVIGGIFTGGASMLGAIGGGK